MNERLSSSNRRSVVLTLGSAQTIAWGSSYYLPAVLAAPMARDLGVSPVWVFAAFSLAMIVAAIVGPWSGRRIDLLGGRGLLMATNFVFATGLLAMAASPNVGFLFASWALMGIGMGMGLYESAFATLAGIYGKDARSPITGITLIAGFASTLAWPLTGLLDAHVGWRWACVVWAGCHLLVALPLNALLPISSSCDLSRPTSASETPIEGKDSFLATALLSFVFAATWFSSTAMATHLPRLLEASGASTAVAIAAAALIGPAQVAARLAEFGLLQRFHPLVSAQIAAAAHPFGAVLLLLIGGPAAYAFTLLHGAGNGVLTIAKGTLPLALFGSAGYGQRQGILNAPARILQAIAPLLFGYLLERYGANAICFTLALGVTSFLAIIALGVIAKEE